jgi:hypothetical protein
VGRAGLEPATNDVRGRELLGDIGSQRKGGESAGQRLARHGSSDTPNPHADAESLR